MNVLSTAFRLALIKFLYILFYGFFMLEQQTFSKNVREAFMIIYVFQTFEQSTTVCS